MRARDGRRDFSNVGGSYSMWHILNQLKIKKLKITLKMSVN